MAQYRKTVFSLGGPERIADPGDDVMLELGRQALARQQAEAQNAIARARLGMDAQQQAADMDFRERTLAAQLGQQSAAASGLVYDPSTGGYATDPNTGDYLKTQDSHALALQLGRAQREQEEAAWNRQMAERNFSAEDRRAQEARAHQMLLAKMQDETQQKRIDLSERTARQREDELWRRQVQREDAMLTRDDEKDKDRQAAEKRKRDAEIAEEAALVAGRAAAGVRQGLSASDIGDAPDVRRGMLQRGNPSLALALGESEAVRAAREQIVQSFAGGADWAVIRPAEVDNIERANSAVIDAFIRENVEREKTETYPDVGEWIVYGEALKRANADAANAARQRVGAQPVPAERMAPEEWDKANLAIIGRAAERSPGEVPGVGPVGASGVSTGAAAWLARALGLAKE
jgi:hypothetical protein